VAELLHFLGDDFPAEHPYADRVYAVPGPAQDRLNGVTPPTGRLPVGLYRTVLHEGLHDDLPHCLNQDLLLQMWPVLRTLVGRTVHTVWEDASLSSPPAPGQPRDGHAGAAHAAPGGCDRARLPVSPGSHRRICRTGAPPREPPQPGPRWRHREPCAHGRHHSHAPRRPGSPRLEGARAGDRSAVRPLHRVRPGHRAGSEVDILKEIFWRPVAQSPCPSSRRRT
jgi:hypothetical protein